MHLRHVPRLAPRAPFRSPPERARTPRGREAAPCDRRRRTRRSRRTPRATTSAARPSSRAMTKARRSAAGRGRRGVPSSASQGLRGPQLRHRLAERDPRMHAALVRCRDRHESRDLRSAEASKVGAHHEPAHAVRDDDDLACAGVREDRVDLRRGLLGEQFDRRERRPVRQRIHRGDAATLQPALERVPDAGIAKHAVDQQDRRIRRRGRRVAHERRGRRSSAVRCRRSSRTRARTAAIRRGRAGECHPGARPGTATRSRTRSIRTTAERPGRRAATPARTATHSSRRRRSTTAQDA